MKSIVGVVAVMSLLGSSVLAVAQGKDDSGAKRPVLTTGLNHVGLTVSDLEASVYTISQFQ